MNRTDAQVLGVQRFARSTLAATPWKNGGGSTCEILSWPPGAGVDAFDWRVSIATIGASGPFSIFEGIDRIIMLLEGDGVRLQALCAGIDQRLDRPHEPFAFSGDLGLDCTLLGGPSIDFNVMTRRMRGHAEVQLIDAADHAPLPPAHGGLLMSLCGRWQVDDEVLGAGEGLWWADANAARGWPAMQSVKTQDATPRLVVVRWTPTALAGRSAL